MTYYDVRGFNNNNSLIYGAGLTYLFDTRDDVYTSKEGIFLKIETGIYNGDYSFKTFNTDLRKFINKNNLVFAWQGKINFLSGAAPFWELPMLGSEEIEEIAPAVAAARESGMDVVGPYPADSVFYRATAGEFDAGMALYHDQGHIAIKMHNFAESITATMGIPFIRTSVDHGTAFDIAGKNKADANGLARALDAAIDMMNGSLK